MVYCAHFEPIGDYRHESERPIAWVLRLYEGCDAEQQFKEKRDYALSITLHRTCLNIAEAKGLTATINREMFCAIMRSIPSIGIEIVEVRHKHRLNVYETKDFIR